MLKKAQSIFCLVALFVLGSPTFVGCNKPNSPPGAVWTDLSPAGGKFSVSLPGTATEKVETAPGGMVSKNYQVITVLNNLRGLGVGYAELQGNPQGVSEVEAVLNQAKDRARDNLDGTVLTESNIALGGHPGKEIQIVSSKGHVVRQRLYLANRRIYNIMTITSRENLDSPEATKFLNSFKILD
jgi:hypothetical protein